MMKFTCPLLLIWILYFPIAGLAQTEEGESGKVGDSEDVVEPEKQEALPSIDTKSENWKLNDGFQPFFRDDDDGRVWLRVSDWDREFLFSYGLGTGLGSNPVGLDRGQLGDQFVCRFRRVGKKIFLVARNLNYRAITENAIERRAVRESFAESVLWGGKVSAETDSAVLVDITELLTSDLHGISRKLKQTNQGDYSLDGSRSGVYFARCKAFPKNTELEATLTFSGKNPGRLVAQVTPEARTVTLRQHVSFVELPDNNYRPRVHHPRCPSMSIRFSDYAAPLDAPLQKRWIIRHRLEKSDPGSLQSTAVEPIVYYVDPGAPELIRDALVEGASWWNEAFEAAGFIDAFQVKILPDDADPMDVRYNVIQWVHRSTRGWSYGGSVIDPRTGEIIKGHVTLGSLRVRQDRLLFESLAPRLVNASSSIESRFGSCGMAGVTEDTTLASLNRKNDPVEVALARIRQLSAHEVGHTLGFVHNFAASTYDDRASVMDYPAPRINIDADGKLDLSDAYGVGIGTWDKFSVEYAYRPFDQDDEPEQLARLVHNSIEAGLTFVSDGDSRASGASHPRGNLWDNGTDPVEELQHVMRVRRIALGQLGPDILRLGEPLGNLEQMFVPVYLHHRYQVDAVAKMIGGVEYTYDVAGYQSPMKVVSDSAQKRALDGLLATIDPHQLAISDELWQWLTPPSVSSHRNVERFKGRTTPVFDRESSARIAADMTIGNLLLPERVSRLAMTTRDPDTFGPRRLIVDLIDYVWRQPNSPRQILDVSHVIRQSLTDHLLRLASSDRSSVAARSVARFGINRVKQHLQSKVRTGSSQERQFAEMMLEEILRFESRPYPTVDLPEDLPSPPGSPIGSDNR